MRILVTGANGFVGSAVVDALRSAAHEVTGVVRKAGPDCGIPTLNADLTSTAEVNQMSGEFDVIVNCAGLAHQSYSTPESRFFDVNQTGTLNIAQFALKSNIKRFIQISSISVYGKAVYNDLADESVVCVPTGPYAESKLESEKICSKIFAGSGVGLTILRPATVIGENDPGNILKLIKLIDSGRFIRVGKGNNRKSFVYVDDLANAVCASLKAGKEAFQVFNVSTESITVRETVEVIAEALGKEIRSLTVPFSLIEKPLGLLSAVSGKGRIRALYESLGKWAKDDAVDGRRLHEFYKPEYSAKAALRREVDWFKTLK